MKHLLLSIMFIVLSITIVKSQQLNLLESYKGGVKSILWRGIMTSTGVRILIKFKNDSTFNYVKREDGLGTRNIDITGRYAIENKKIFLTDNSGHLIMKLKIKRGHLKRIDHCGQTRLRRNAYLGKDDLKRIPHWLPIRLIFFQTNGLVK